MTRARDNSRLVTTPSSAYDEFEEVFVGSASPTDKKIWIDNTTASAPVIQTLSGGEWFGSRLPSRTAILVQYLVVAGGGGGASVSSGQVYSAPGGGAGGFRSSVTATGGGGILESHLILSPGTSYTVSIGSGGTANNGGSNSVFSTITSVGGGKFAGVGGSGGGAFNFGNTTPGSGTLNQGFAGGSASSASSSGGGGGAGGPGQSNKTGGLGVFNSITGISVGYAGGGGAGIGGVATSGGGSGGASGNNNGIAGVANTGGGGGGASVNNGSRAGGNGGSGVVIIKFPDSYSLNVGVGLTSSNTTSGGFKIYTFTAGTDTVVFS